MQARPQIIIIWIFPILGAAKTKRNTVNNLGTPDFYISHCLCQLIKIISSVTGGEIGARQDLREHNKLACIW